MEALSTTKKKQHKLYDLCELEKWLEQYEKWYKDSTGPQAASGGQPDPPPPPPPGFEPPGP